MFTKMRKVAILPTLCTLANGMCGVTAIMFITNIGPATSMEPVLARAIGRDLKGKLSPVLYLAAIALAFVNQWLATAIYTMVALMWLVPDRRIERALAGQPAGEG